MQPLVEPRCIERINEEINEILSADAKIIEREKAAKRIRITLVGMAKRLSQTGEVKAFGSFSNGFKTGSSDLDVVFVGNVGPDNTVPLLGKFAAMVSEFGFENVTKIFQANVPLVKFTDRRTGMEVDFCINNELGVRNSGLLYAYCKCDERVLQLGRLVKDWAKRHELVGTADGCLNSYAYMLLVIYFLQSLPVPVVPNLQKLATESVPVVDSKWGCEDYWETKFVDDVDSLPPSENTMTVGELLIRFLHFYTREFDWHSHAVCMRENAVCMRENQSGLRIDKFKLHTPTNDDQWYVEDPFDLKHNLAGKCTIVGRKRILDAMSDSLRILSTGGGLSQAYPSEKFEAFFLKSRISQGVTPQALLEEFEEFDLVKLHFPKSDGGGRMGQAFLEFSDGSSRRRAHTKNETYVADCQLQLHYSTQFALAESVRQGPFSTYEMASYKMQRQVLAARVRNLEGPAANLRPEEGPCGSSRQPPGPPPLPYTDGVGNMMMAGHMPPPGNHYGFPPYMQRPMHPQQMMNRQPPGPPPMGGQGHMWGQESHSHMAAQHAGVAAASLAKQHQQLAAEAAAQPRKVEPKKKAEAKGVVVTNASIPNAKAAKAQAKATQQQATAAIPFGNKHSTAKTQTSQSSKGHGWLAISIQKDPLKDSPPLLSKNQVAVIQDFLQTWQPLKLAEGKARDQITLQVEVKEELSVQRGALFSEEDRVKIQSIKDWLDRRKMG